MKTTIPHPSDPKVRAEVGWDHAVGWFADIIRGRRKTESYSTVHPGYDRERPLLGLLLFLSVQGFYGEEDLIDALDRVQHEDLTDLPPELRRVVKIVTLVKGTADPP